MKAIFIDRDGVINRNTHYVNKLENFYIFPFVKDALMLLKQFGYKIFIVTNQGGIEKGYIELDELNKIHSYMLNELPQIDDIRYCPDYNSFDRKPNPGMIYDLAYDYEIYLNDSYMIGDMGTDMLAGKRAGCKTIFITSSFEETIKNHKNPNINYYCENLLEAAKLIMVNEEYIT